jgi:hypothetical protein
MGGSGMTVGARQRAAVPLELAHSHLSSFEDLQTRSFVSH